MQKIILHFMLLFIETDLVIRCGISGFSVSHSNSEIVTDRAEQTAQVLNLNTAVLRA